MKFNQVEAYRAVMLAGSVSDAAHFLNVSQPGISRLIKDLEQSVGFSLFTRIPGRIIPTPEGEAFFKHVQRVYHGLQSLEGAARDIANLKHDRLRIASFPAASLGAVPEAVVRMNEGFPDLKIRLEVQASSRVLELVSSQQIDVGIAAFPVDYPGVIVERVYKPFCKCVLSGDHPKAAMPRIALADLAGERTIGISEDLSIGHAMRAACREAGVPVENGVETTSAYAVCRMVESGLGIGVVDPLTAAVFRNSGVRILEFEPDIPFNFAIVLSEHAPRSQAVDRFVKLLHEILKRAIMPPAGA
jgi:DNA-binding transcriptional LysR family regulator